MAKCSVCYRHCEIEEGKTGFCGVRTCRDGVIGPLNYGRITSLALDPIEKKPLSRFMPGSYVLSVGSYGCNLRCPFCQNYEISWSEEAYEYGEQAQEISSSLTWRFSTEAGEISVWLSPTMSHWWAMSLSGILLSSSMRMA